MTQGIQHLDILHLSFHNFLVLHCQVLAAILWRLPLTLVDSILPLDS